MKPRENGMIKNSMPPFMDSPSCIIRFRMKCRFHAISSRSIVNILVTVPVIMLRIVYCDEQPRRYLWHPPPPPFSFVGVRLDLPLLPVINDRSLTYIPNFWCQGVFRLSHGGWEMGPNRTAQCLSVYSKQNLHN